MGAEVFHALKKLLKDAGHNTAVGDEGGFAPNVDHRGGAGIHREGDRGGRLQAGRGHRARPRRAPRASSSRTASYHLEGEGKTLDRRGHGRLARGPGASKYPIVSIEDGMAEDDWDGWKPLTETLGDKVQLVGDDLFVTNPAILAKGIDEGIANSILIKVNQIGTLTETLDAVELATARRLHARSSRTAPARPRTPPSPTSPWPPTAARSRPARSSRSDRMAKYNQLLRIEKSWATGRSTRGGRGWRAAEAEGRGMVANLLGDGLSGWLRGRWLAVGGHAGPRLLRLPRPARPLRLPGLDRHLARPRAGAAGAGGAVAPSASGWSATSRHSSPIRSTATCSRSSCACWAMSGRTR